MFSTPTLSTVTEATTITFHSVKTDEFKKDSIVCIVEGRGNAQGEIGKIIFMFLFIKLNYILT